LIVLYRQVNNTDKMVYKTYKGVKPAWYLVLKSNFISNEESNPHFNDI